MARKPLISAGSYLGERDFDTAPDLMANVIARDRERSGRTAPAEPVPVEPAQVETSSPGKPTVRTSPVDETTVPVPTTAPVAVAKPKPAEKTAAKSEGESRDAVWRRARRKASSMALPITLRCPDALNDFLDQLAHDLRRSKVKKQELVSLAIQMLYVEAESGADILSLLGRRTEEPDDEEG